MDTEATTQKMRDLFSKARGARKEGKRDLAATFRSGARRLQRQLAAEKIKAGGGTKKKSKD